MSACQRPWRAFTCWLSLAFTVGVSLFFCNPRFLSEPAKGDFENKPISGEPAEEEHPLISRGIAKKSTASFQHVHTSFSNFGPQKNMIDRQHTRDQCLLTALIGFRLADPIRGSINGVLSEKQVQLGRMFLHVAHGVQEEL